MTRRYCGALLSDGSICGKAVTGSTALLCDGCKAARIPVPIKPPQVHRPRCTHPKERLGYSYFSIQGWSWYWRCDRCGAIRAADLPDEEDVKVIHADSHTASLYGEPAT